MNNIVGWRGLILPGVPWLVCGVIVAVALTGACLGEVPPSRSELELRLPTREGFERVADALQPSCGTLDCHGQTTRNLRLVGGRGLRLDSKDSSAEGTTTPAEYEANYWALVALEPEALSAVITDGGSNPERLILIRKGRGTTAHKGGALMHLDGDLDQCAVEWLKGRILVERCEAAARITGALP